MLTPKEFIEIFPFFQKGSPEVVEEILSSARYVALPASTIIQLEGEPCDGLGFMLSGVARVYKAASSGRELTLYEVGPGEVCMLSASSILSDTVSHVDAISVTDVRMLAVPANSLRKLVDRYEEMRSFFFFVISRRFASMVELIEEITFKKMDERLLHYLREKSGQGKLSKTHQEIANDLGTAREVVSRLLKELEREGTIRLSRHCIDLTNP